MSTLLAAMLLLASQCEPALLRLAQACEVDAATCAQARPDVEALLADEARWPESTGNEIASLSDTSTWAQRVRASCQALATQVVRTDLDREAMLARALEDPRLRREHHGANPLEPWLRALGLWLSQLLDLHETRAMAAAVRIGFLALLIGLLLAILVRLSRQAAAPRDEHRSGATSTDRSTSPSADVRALLLDTAEPLARLRLGVELLADQLVQTRTLLQARTCTVDEIARHATVRRLPPDLQAQLHQALDLYGRAVFARQPVSPENGACFIDQVVAVHQHLSPGQRP